MNTISHNRSFPEETPPVPPPTAYNCLYSSKNGDMELGYKDGFAETETGTVRSKENRFGLSFKVVMGIVAVAGGLLLTFLVYLTH